jgi:hypothetical protein
MRWIYSQGSATWQMWRTTATESDCPQIHRSSSIKQSVKLHLASFPTQEKGHLLLPFLGWQSKKLTTIECRFYTVEEAEQLPSVS